MQAKQQEATKEIEVKQIDELDFSKDDLHEFNRAKDALEERGVEHTAIVSEPEPQEEKDVREIELGDANEAFKNHDIEHNDIWTDQENQLVRQDHVHGQDLVAKYGQPSPEQDQVKEIEPDMEQ